MTRNFVFTTYADNPLQYSAVQILYTNISASNKTYSDTTQSDLKRTLDYYLGLQCNGIPDPGNCNK